MEDKPAITRQVEESMALKRTLIAQSDTLIKIANEVTQAFRRGNEVLLLGNAGSAADARHTGCEPASSF